MLQGIPYEIVTLAYVSIKLAASETCKTMEENAYIKAKAYAEQGTLLTLADDSRLEFDALNGSRGSPVAMLARALRIGRE